MIPEAEARISAYEARVARRVFGVWLVGAALLWVCVWLANEMANYAEILHGRASLSADCFILSPTTEPQA